MVQCIYDCARCALDVDKGLCCSFQTLRLLAEVKTMLSNPSAEPKPPKTIADLADEDNQVKPE
jgi:hypothetical protein